MSLIEEREQVCVYLPEVVQRMERSKRLGSFVSPKVVVLPRNSLRMLS